MYDFSQIFLIMGENFYIDTVVLKNPCEIGHTDVKVFIFEQNDAEKFV